MPYVDYALAGAVSATQAEQVKAETARILSQYAGKPEQWLYIRVTPNQSLFFQGEPVSEGAIAEVKLIGSLSQQQKQEITAALGQLLQKELSIPAEKTYVIFTEVKGENWGWNGQLFG
ncbi:MAG TPA: phenylpyruvate tautomerase MIF-related protein [Bacillota bacterium]